MFYLLSQILVSASVEIGECFRLHCTHSGWSFYFQVLVILHVVALAYYVKRLLTPKMFRVAVAFVVVVGM
jgi:hypothetical protein